MIMELNFGCNGGDLTNETMDLICFFLWIFMGFELWDLILDLKGLNGI